jgi:WD40 repeat protein
VAAAEALKLSREAAAQVCKTLPEYGGTVWSAAFSPDGKLLATGGHRQAIKVWDLATGQERFPAPAKDEKAPEKK